MLKVLYPHPRNFLHSMLTSFSQSPAATTGCTIYKLSDEHSALQGTYSIRYVHHKILLCAVYKIKTIYICEIQVLSTAAATVCTRRQGIALGNGMRSWYVYVYDSPAATHLRLLNQLLVDSASEPVRRSISFYEHLGRSQKYNAHSYIIQERYRTVNIHWYFDVCFTLTF